MKLLIWKRKDKDKEKRKAKGNFSYGVNADTFPANRAPALPRL